MHAAARNERLVAQSWNFSSLWTRHDSLSGSGGEKENWSALSNTVNFKE